MTTTLLRGNRQHFIVILSMMLMMMGFTLACTKVNTWGDLIRRVNSAQRDDNVSQLSLCPFQVSKPTNAKLVLNRTLTLRCSKSNGNDKCKIVGDGPHVRIQGADAKFRLVGFTFEGASESAIRVYSSATKTQHFINCEFLRNKGGVVGWRGGAIKTELNTSVVMEGCRFIGNAATDGGAIFHRGKSMFIRQTVFNENESNDGPALMTAESSPAEIFNSNFNRNVARNRNGGPVALLGGISTLKYNGLNGSGNNRCNGIRDKKTKKCHFFGGGTADANNGQSTDPKSEFRFGDLTLNSSGFRLSNGLKLKIIARAGQRIRFDSPQAARTYSTRRFHSNPDGAAVFNMPGGGWIYMSNSENTGGRGGVYGVVFDANGRIKDYVQRLTGTTRNCQHGTTPWNTFVSCEEFSKGQCWQVDPTGRRPAEKTKLTELEGGNFEAMAYDTMNPNRPRYYVTEDHERGALRRYTPPACSGKPCWNSLHVNGGRRDYLEILPNGRFQWTRSLARGRQSAFQHFQYTEGIVQENGILSFVAKTTKRIFRLDLQKRTYTVQKTDRRRIPGGGSFEAQPDQILKVGQLLYFTEDGGKTPGVYAKKGSDHFALFEARNDKFHGDETTGLALSPDKKKIYVCIQRIGYLLQVERIDGRPFEGGVGGLKFHSTEA